MSNADPAGAREFAAGYLAWIAPRWQQLAGREADLTYSVEILREKYGLPSTGAPIEVHLVPAVWLIQAAQTCPYAYRVFDELRTLPAGLTGSGADLLKAANITTPKAQGNREQNGVRDLILSILWVELQRFGLPKENKVRTGRRPFIPSIGAVISDALANAPGIRVTIAPRTILAAVNKRTRN